MDKRIKMTDTDKINYFVKEQKAMEYGAQFFKDLCKIDIKTIDDNVLPFTCYNQLEELLYSLDTDDRTTVIGGFVYAGEKQAYIRIGIDTRNSILNKSLKQIIRHEIIHYYLWLLDLPFSDDALEFWCLCYAYDAGAYENLDYDNEEYYKLFVDVFDSCVVNLPSNIKYIVLGQMIENIRSTPIEKYKDFVIDMVTQVKKLFSRLK